ncbi:Ribonuclease H-like domain containing protein [Melia azedarach]|uniref:Ribonuclease H-like domain containing protein n=1 Tax=Melia azedarach TaxID=155640 RepID=A0ACC1X339_MELAZ|nr:Ribonuclease H-like domain containing protein [Melia azedarach]
MASRNFMLYEGKIEDPSITIARAEVFMESYTTANEELNSVLVTKRTAISLNWEPPPQNWYKLNVDAATRNQDRLAGIRAIVRSSNGDIMTAAISKKPFWGDVELVKAKAMRFDIKVATESGLYPLIVESDAQNVVNLVKGNLESKGDICWVISEIQSYMMEKNKVYFVPRICNSAAHKLAKLTFSYQ